MPNRLFLALWPDDATRAALHAAAKGVLVRHESGGMRIPESAFHLTLVFLGDTPAAQELAVREAMARVRHAPFAFELNIASSFRDSDIWWLGSRNLSPELAELRRLVRDQVAGTDARYDSKRFAPHVSILRGAKRSQPPTQIQAIDWPVSDFVLVRSVMADAFPRYELVERWPLQAPDPAAEQFKLL